MREAEAQGSFARLRIQIALSQQAASQGSKFVVIGDARGRNTIVKALKRIPAKQRAQVLRQLNKLAGAYGDTATGKRAARLLANMKSPAKSSPAVVARKNQPKGARGRRRPGRRLAASRSVQID